MLQFVGATSGTTSASLPTGWQPGDLAIVFAFRDGSTTAPSLPTGWTNIINGGANTCSQRVGYRVLQSGDTSTSTWTDATTVLCCVYRGQDTTTPIGASEQGGGSSTTVTYPALTLQQTNGNSMVFCAAGHRSTNTALENPPTGTVRRVNDVDATDEGSAFDTNNGVLVWTAKSVSVGGTSSGWRAVSVEIRAAVRVPEEGHAMIFWPPTLHSPSGLWRPGTEGRSIEAFGAGVGPAAGASAHSKGAWQVISPAGGWDHDVTDLYVTFWVEASGSYTVLYDLGVVVNGVQQVVLANLHYARTLNNGRGMPVHLPWTIPAGTVLVARAQASTGGVTCNVVGNVANRGAPTCTRWQTLGADTTASRGTALSPGTAFTSFGTLDFDTRCLVAIIGPTNGQTVTSVGALLTVRAGGSPVWSGFVLFRGTSDGGAETTAWTIPVALPAGATLEARQEFGTQTFYALFLAGG